MAAPCLDGIVRWTCAIALCLGASACGGGSTLPSASDCFNPQLFAVGSKYELDYQVSGTVTATQNRSVTVQASPATGASDVSVQTVVYTAYDPPVPGQTIPATFKDVQTLDGLDILTKQHILVAGPGMEMPTVYDPPLRDHRFSLLQGEAFAFDNTTITYVGKESITVPAGTFEACRFDEVAADGTAKQTTWVLKDYGVLAKSIGAPVSMQLLPTSSINGQPIVQLQSK